MEKSNLIRIVIGLVVAVASFFIGRHVSMDIVGGNLPVVDSMFIAQVEAQYDSLVVVIDSLQTKLNEKPPMVIKYVNKPIPVLIRGKDSVVVQKIGVPVLVPIKGKDSLIYVEDTTLIPDLEPTQYGAEAFIVGEEGKQTVVKLKKRLIKEGEALYLMDGENLDSYLDIYYTKYNMKRRLKYNTTCVYSLLISTDVEVDKRFSKILRNKNQF